ncbi:MAG: hypothetical protein ABI552_06210 [Casimicrobiaceae bacterium]
MMTPRTPVRSTLRRGAQRSSVAASQRGIVLFVALIVMVALSLAGIALIRSVDTTASVTGNIAFRQAALLQANWAVEDAIGHIYASDTVVPAQLIDPTADAAAKFYLATFDPTKDSTKAAQPALPAGVPDVLWKKSGAWPTALASDANGRNSVKYVIQRMCMSDLALPSAPVPEKCELMQPKQAMGTTIGDEALKTGKFPLYRVTVRVDGPNNSLAFVQAMIRG